MGLQSFPPSILGLFGLVASVVTFAIVSLLAAQKSTTAYQFFHVESKYSTKRATISIVCANITLGTGLAYFISQARSSGFYALIIPFSVLIGYMLVSMFIAKVPFTPSDDSPNLLRFLSKSHPTFFGIYNTVLILTYVLIVAFELLTSASILNLVLFPNLSESSAAPLALFLLLTVLAYILVGGQRGSIATDVWEFPVEFIFIIALSMVLIAMKYGVLEPPHGSAIANTSTPPHPDWVLLLFGVLAAIATQFYDIANLSIGSNFYHLDQAVIFRRAGIILWFVLSVFVLSGVLVRDTLAENALPALFVPLTQSSAIGYILTPLIVVGCVAILFSSLESVLVSTSQIMVENGFKIFLTEEKIRKLSVTYARAGSTFVALVLCAGFVLLIPYAKNAAALLLTIVYAITAFAPLMAALIWLEANKKHSFLRSPWFIVCYVLFAIAFWIYTASAAEDAVKSLVQLVSLMLLTLICLAGAAVGRREAVL